MSTIIDYAAAAMEHNRVVSEFFTHEAARMDALTRLLANRFNTGNKLLICGNGGSACDAMHIAGEFVGRFKLERDGLPAIALSADAGIITALANDYSFERIFARQVEALGSAGDLLIGLTTSGSSRNVLDAFAAADRQQITRITFTGRRGVTLADSLEYGFVIDSDVTATIQECTMMALHLLAEGVENRMQAMTAH